MQTPQLCTLHFLSHLPDAERVLWSPRGLPWCGEVRVCPGTSAMPRRRPHLPWCLRVAYSSFTGERGHRPCLCVRENSVPDAGMEAASSVAFSASQDCISSQLCPSMRANRQVLAELHLLTNFPLLFSVKYLYVLGCSGAKS